MMGLEPTTSSVTGKRLYLLSSNASVAQGRDSPSMHDPATKVTSSNYGVLHSRQQLPLRVNEGNRNPIFRITIGCNNLYTTPTRRYFYYSTDSFKFCQEHFSSRLDYLSFNHHVWDEILIYQAAKPASTSSLHLRHTSKAQVAGAPRHHVYFYATDIFKVCQDLLSEWQDSNLRPSFPQKDELPGCSTFCCTSSERQDLNLQLLESKSSTLPN